MITAAEALRLDRARLTEKERGQLVDVLTRIDAHIRETMKFTGPAPLDVPVHHASSAVVKAICVEMTKHGWTVSGQLFSLPPTIRDAPATPHHWTLAFDPSPGAYVDAGQPEVRLLQ